MAYVLLILIKVLYVFNCPQCLQIKFIYRIYVRYGKCRNPCMSKQIKLIISNITLSSLMKSGTLYWSLVQRACGVLLAFGKEWKIVLLDGEKALEQTFLYPSLLERFGSAVFWSNVLFPPCLTTDLISNPPARY